MNNIWKRSLSMLLALVMVMGMLPMGALAEELEASPACDHAYAAGETLAPTCTEAGYTVYTCGLCGDSYQDAAQALGHDWSVWEANEEESSEQRVCAACGDTETQYFAEAEETVVSEDVMAAGSTNINEAHALIWLDSTRQDDLASAITGQKLDDIILKALGTTGTVKYDGVNVGDFLALARNEEKIDALKNAIKAHELVTFTVSKGGNFKEYKIAFRNVNNAYPVVKINKDPSADPSTVTISDKTAPADLKAQIEKYRDEAVFTLQYRYESGSVSIDETIPLDLAKAVTTISDINTAWPAPEKTAVAVEITLTIQDDLDGETKKSGSAKVVLENTTQRYNIIFTAGKKDVFEDKVYQIVEGEDIPYYDPGHPAFDGWDGWDRGIPKKATEDMTFTAKLIEYTVTYTDGQGGAVFANETFTVLKGSKAPAFSRTAELAELKYNGLRFTKWNYTKDDLGNITYKAEWGVDSDLLVYYYCDETDMTDYFTQGLLQDGTAWYFGEDIMGEDGMRFLGWYQKVNGEYIPWNFDTKVTSNLSLYARYAVDKGSVITLGDLKTTAKNGTISVYEKPDQSGESSFLGKIVVPGGVTEIDGDYKFKGAGTTITIIPDVDDDGVSYTYVKSVTVNGTPLNLIYGDGFSVTCELPELPPVVDSEGAAYVVEVEFAWADIVDVDNVVLAPELAFGSNTKTEDIYNAIVPSGSDCDAEGAEKVGVQYKARDARKEPVDISGLEDLIAEYQDLAKEAGYNIDLEAAYNDLLNEDGKYEVTLEEAWLDYDSDAVAASKTAQDVVNEYIADLKADPMSLISKVMGASSTDALMDELEEEMKEALKDAELEPFAYNATTSAEITEQVKLFYQGKAMNAESPVVDLKIADERAATTMSISTKSYTKMYGSFKDSDILGNVTVMAEGEEIHVPLTCVKLSELNVGTYKAVRVSFPGNEEYKPSSVTFDLTVTKGKASIDVQRINVESGVQYNAAPTVSPKGVEYIQVIVGMDMTEIDVDLSKADVTFDGVTLPVSAYVKNVRPKAWIKAPKAIKDLLKNRGIDVSKDNSYTLDEIEEILSENAVFLAKFHVTEDRLDYILRAMETIEKVAGVELTVSFADDAVPYDSGVYLNAAVVTDANYETAYDADVLLVQPVICMPNQGGVQLFLEENDKKVIENVFELPNINAPYELSVAYKGEKVYDATVYYYGLTDGLAVHYTTAAPSEPGVYIATTVYSSVNENGKDVVLGGDTAVMIIGLAKADVQIPSVESVKYDGNPHKATITVKNADGKEIKDAALTIVTGTATADKLDANITIDEIKANVNIDFPAALDNAWPEFVKYAAELGADYPADITLASAQPEDIRMFLNWCDEQVDKVALQLKDNKYTDKAIELMNSSYADKVYDSKYWDRIESKIPTQILKRMNAPLDAIDEAAGYGHRVIARIFKEINPMLDALPEDVTISFRNNVQFTEKGAYLYAAIVTDPDYIPDADAGVLIITSEKDYYMIDTTVPYDGEEHTPYMVNETGREGVDMYIDTANRIINFNMTQEDADAFIERLQNKFNARFDTNVEVRGKSITVEELYSKAEVKEQNLEDAVVDWVKDFVIAHFNAEGRLNEDAILELIDKHVAGFENLQKDISDKITGHEDYDKYDHWKDYTLVVNGAMPKLPGEYYFVGLNYDVAYTDAILNIIPAEIVVTASSGIINVGEDFDLITLIQVKDGEGAMMDLDAYSDLYEKITASAVLVDENGNEIALADAVKNAGTYTIVVSATCTENIEYATISTVNGTLVVQKEAIPTGTIGEVDFTLTLEGVVYMEYTMDMEGFEGVDLTEKGGVVIWTGDSAPASASQLVVGGENCVYLDNMYWSEQFGKWAVTSLGINAKEYGDAIYVRPCVEVAEGVYVYREKGIKASPKMYCEQKLTGGQTGKLQDACAALLEYGAAAQEYFDYKLDAMVNVSNKFDLSIYDLAFNEDMIDPLVNPTPDKYNSLSGIKANVGSSKATLSLMGAIILEVIYPNVTVEDIASAELLVWTKADYDAAETLAYEAETYSYKVPLQMGQLVGFTGYVASSEHIPAKEIGDTIYYSARFVTENGEIYRSGLSVYSPDRYVQEKLNSGDPELVKAVKALAVYSEKARAYFNY